MSKHAIGGMRSMMVPNCKADMRYRKKAYIRSKNIYESYDRVEALTERRELKRLVELVKLKEGDCNRCVGIHEADSKA